MRENPSTGLTSIYFTKYVKVKIYGSFYTADKL